MRAPLVAMALLALAVQALAAPVPGAPCPGPFDYSLGDGNAGSHILVDLGCDGGPIKVCAPTWIGNVDLLLVC